MEFSDISQCGNSLRYWCMPNAIKILLVLCGHTITSFLPFHQCLLGKKLLWGIHILLPPCTHTGMGERQLIHFHPGEWAKCPITIPLFKPQKRLFTLDFIEQNQTQISSFSICPRELTVCSGELQSRTSDMQWLRAHRPSTSLRASWNILQSPWIRVLGYSTGCSLISLRKQNLQDLKHLNIDRQI